MVGMENLILTSIQNPLIKQVRKLHRAKERQKQNLLAIEGTNSIAAALQADYKLDTVFCTESWQERHLSLYQQMNAKQIAVRLVSYEVLQAIATTVNPDGVMATAPRLPPLTTMPQIHKLGLAIERLQDPGNLGTIIRTAAAVGIDNICLSRDSVDLYSPKVLRASTGSWFDVPVITDCDLTQLVLQQRQQNVEIVATTSRSTKTYWELDFSRPSLILLGNEGAGLSPELIRASR